MIIKAADSRDADILALEALALRPDLTRDTRAAIEHELRTLRSGTKGERDAAYLIDLHFGPSDNWAVIHDLRIEVGDHSAQIDHLIINRLAQVWVCESKRVTGSITVNEQGEWSRQWNGRRTGIPSPIEQNRRHVLLLERAFDLGMIQAPKRLGLVRRRPDLRSLVLLSDTADVRRPRRRVDGLETVLKVDQLKTRLFDEFDRTPDRSVLGAIGKQGLEALARELAALHRPGSWDWAARFGVPPEAPSTAAVPATVPGPAPGRKPWLVKYDGPCSACGRILNAGTEAHWDHAKRRMLCLGCASG